MKVSLNGYGESVTTFEAEDSVKVGYPVKMTDNGKVGLCKAKEAFCGIALNVRNGFAAVQLQGYYSGLTYTGSGMKVGILKLGAVSEKVEVSETGKECLVVDIDSESSTCGIIL